MNRVAVVYNARSGALITSAEEKYEGENVQVRSAKMSVMSVMSDGEISQLSMPLRYEIQPRALAVLAPGAVT